METWIWVIGSVLGVSLISFVGVLTLFWKEQSLKTWLLYLVSFAAGTLLGDAFFHLMPELFENAGENGLGIGLTIAAGFLLFLIIEKTLHWHHHSSQHDCETDHPKTLGMLNLFGDGLHNFIDGLIIAGSYLVSIPIGIATTIAVVFHEIPQEFGDFGILLYAGFSRKRALAFNFLSAFTAVIGAAIALALASQIEDIAIPLLGIATGGFIYVAAVDLIPETKKDTKLPAIWRHTALLFIGMIVMYALTFLG